MATNIGISITPEEEILIKVVSIPQGPIEWPWLNNTVHIISGKSSININLIIKKKKIVNYKINDNTYI